MIETTKVRINTNFILTLMTAAPPLHNIRNLV